MRIYGDEVAMSACDGHNKEHVRNEPPHFLYQILLYNHKNYICFSRQSLATSQRHVATTAPRMQFAIDYTIDIER